MPVQHFPIDCHLVAVSLLGEGAPDLLGEGCVLGEEGEDLGGGAEVDEARADHILNHLREVGKRTFKGKGGNIREECG